jgi:iron(III) transport system substrate-binding protein
VYIFGKHGRRSITFASRRCWPRHHVGIQAKAPHPNAARLFYDYFISREGMEILAKEGEFVTAKGLYPPIKDAEKVNAVAMDELDAAEYKKWAAEFRKLFAAR